MHSEYGLSCETSLAGAWVLDDTRPVLDQPADIKFVVADAIARFTEPWTMLNAKAWPKPFSTRLRWRDASGRVP
jgi:hypothetical protein